MKISDFLNNDFYKIEHRKTVTSTNDLVKEYAKIGESEGLVLIADLQTKGKGRLTRSFYSPSGTGIYMSILLRPEIPPERFTDLTPLSAVAVCLSIEKVFKRTSEIKWVNDIYVGGKKVCGILTESGTDLKDGSPFAVVGIGVNITKPEGDFPDDLKDKAGAICDSISDELKAKFIAEILNGFYGIYKNIEAKSFYNEYKNRSLVLGKQIQFEKDGKTFIAVATDIDENFSLIAKDENGKTFSVFSGEVSIVL